MFSILADLATSRQCPPPPRLRRGPLQARERPGTIRAPASGQGVQLSAVPLSGRLAAVPDNSRDGGPDDAAEDKLLTALTTEHFVLQSVRGGISGEATSRATLYLSALSASLVALGFVIGQDVFGYFACAVLPVLAALGLLTYVRLVEIGIEDMGHLASIQRIRRYYAGLSPLGAHFFPDLTPVPGDVDGDDEEDSLRFMSLRGGRWQMWFTAASVVGVINSMLAGAGVALAAGGFGVDPAHATVVGALAAIVLVLLHMRFQRRRYEMAGRSWGQ